MTPRLLGVAGRLTRAILATSAILLTVGCGSDREAYRRQLIVSTTTSVNDSGLLRVLLPRFERQTGYVVRVASVGSGAALLLGSRGEADVVVSHAPSLEARFLRAGSLVNRRPFMCNEFVIVGPDADPAQIRGLDSAPAAFRRIAARRAPFVSRGDQSGTHTLELQVWKQAGIVPSGAWYLRSGSGMGDTLRVAGDQSAYTVSDRGTFLKLRQQVDLVPLVQDSAHLQNVYAVLEVHRRGRPAVNRAGGEAFSAFLLNPDTQDEIRRYGVDRFGEPLFRPLRECEPPRPEGMTVSRNSEDDPPGSRRSAR